MAREVCVCGHTDEDHTSRLLGTKLPPPESTLAFAPGHGMCLKCDCARFTWDGWTPEFEEELNRRGKGS